MIAELLSELLIANLAAAAAILVILAVRKSARRRFGPRIAYALWLAAPLAGLAVFLPTPGFIAPSAPMQAVAASTEDILTLEMFLAVPGAAAQAQPQVIDLALPALGIWLLGFLISLGLVALTYRRSLASFGALSPAMDDPKVLRASLPGLGPALVGAFRPRLVLPADFETRFDDREQALVLAHERWHLVTGDALVNGVATLFVCLNWFNPLAYVAAFYARVDQELACDAAVVAQHPGERRRYATALMKTQVANAPLPLGCYWPGRGSRLLKERVETLSAAAPGRVGRVAGVAAVFLIVGGAGYAAWAAHPSVRDLPLPASALAVFDPAKVALPPPLIAEASPRPSRPLADARREEPLEITPARSDIETAITAGDLAQVARLGGSERDIIQAQYAAGDGEFARRILPETARLVNRNGQVAIEGSNAQGARSLFTPRALAEIAPGPEIPLAAPPPPPPEGGAVYGPDQVRGVMNFVRRPPAEPAP